MDVRASHIDKTIILLHYRTYFLFCQGVLLHFFAVFCADSCSRRCKFALYPRVCCTFLQRFVQIFAVNQANICTFSRDVLKKNLNIS